MAVQLNGQFGLAVYHHSEIERAQRQLVRRNVTKLEARTAGAFLILLF